MGADQKGARIAMYKYEAEEFANYEVFELIGPEKKYHCLCVCEEYEVAETIAVLFAKADTSHDHYFITGINNPGDFVIGGGWHNEYWTDEEGKLHKSSLS